MSEAERLSELAHRDYGELVARIDTWPAGLGIDVHLIGGDVVQYLPDGTRYVVDQPSGRMRARRAIAALRGWVRNLDRAGPPSRSNVDTHEEDEGMKLWTEETPPSKGSDDD